MSRFGQLSTARTAEVVLAHAGKCATCGGKPQFTVYNNETEDGIEIVYRCHGRRERATFDSQKLLLEFDWHLVLRPFWPGFARYKGPVYGDRRQLWRERRAAAQAARAKHARAMGSQLAVVSRFLGWA